MTHRDRVGGSSGRRKVAGDAVHRQNFSTPPRRAAYATGTAAYQGFRTVSRTLCDAPHRHSARSWPKTLVSRLYGS